jgi:phage FluMu protein Com
MPQPVEIRCPECDRFLADVRDLGRVVCPDCKCEIVYRSHSERLNVDRRPTEPIRFPRRGPVAARNSQRQ